MSLTISDHKYSKVNEKLEEVHTEYKVKSVQKIMI